MLARDSAAVYDNSIESSGKDVDLRMKAGRKEKRDCTKAGDLSAQTKNLWSLRLDIGPERVLNNGGKITSGASLANWSIRKAENPSTRGLSNHSM